MPPRPDFAAHRRRLLERLEPDEAVLLWGAPPKTRNSDTEYRYRQDSDVWWLTGWPDPDCAVFVRPGDEPVTMFVQARDKEQETWTGRRPGPEGAKERYGADAAFPIGDLEGELARLLQGVSRLHYGFGRDAAKDRMLNRVIARAAKAARRNGLDVPETFHAPARLLHELRLHKGDDELVVMREAARITCEAHVAAMRLGAPGRTEYEIEAEIERVFRHGGATAPGYTTIVGAGDNATILHYVVNDDVVQDGELVLVDAGCEVAGYTADVTRTWPANGRFSGPQRAVYEAVLHAQELAVAACRPGATHLGVHDVAVRALTEAMVDLGLLKGSVDELIEKEAFKRYYMHGTGHWLGCDVHDVGAYARHGSSRVLEPGMVLTVEPGLYIDLDDADAPEALRGIGVRIEDDVLITADGHENLTAACPKKVDDLEDLCRR
jgi:Xaa-Pro aminopeptidase